MNNQAKLKLEKIKKLKLPEKVRATADKIEKGLSSADEATQKKAEDALNKLYDQIKAVAAKKREEKTEKEVNEKTIVPQNADIAAPEEKKELTKKATVADDIIDKALKSDPELAGFGKSDKRRDAGRKAQPVGRRVSRKGWKNQYGKSDGGRVYYEGRENRTDRKSPSFKSGYPYLAKGGKIHPMDDEDGTFYVNHYKTKGDQISSVDEREYKSKASAMTYAMMKSNFLKVGESIFVMNDDGDVLYTSIGTKKMAMGGKFAWQDAQVGDSARVILENKMGTIVVTYGRRFHLKFPDGTEKTYSAEELEFYPDGEFAKGGYMADGENYEYVNTFKRFDSNVPVPQEDFEKLVDAYHKQLSGDKLAVSKYKVLKLKMGNYLGHKTVDEMESYIEKTHNAHKMAKGGYVDIEANLIKELQKLQRDLNSQRLSQYKPYDTSEEEMARKRERDSKIARFNEILELLRQIEAKKMADGGVTSKLTYIPRRQIKLIIIKNPNKKGTRNYLMIDKKDFLDGLYLEKGGKIDKARYTYIPRTEVNQVVTTQDKIYSNPKNGFWVKWEALNKAGRNLEKTFKKDDVVYNEETNTIGIVRSDSYGDGTTKTDSDGVVSTDILTKYNGLTHATASIAPSTLKEITDRKLVDEGMADGGKIGFEAFSKKVASRYAGKKVQPKYQSEYGKTYNAEEAKEVGDKVAAKVYRMQQGKMAKGGELEKGIATEMKEHGMSREEATKTAQDHLKEDAKYYTKMAEIGLKNGGKINLPYELDRYFTKPKGTIEVEISKLIPIRARKSGIENAEVYMKKAYDGEMAKRKPIEIYKTRNKKYRVNDGNSTFAVAKKNGWETIYATVVSNPNVKARVEKSTFTIAKEIRKEGEKWADTLQRVKNMRK